MDGMPTPTPLVAERWQQPLAPPAIGIATGYAVGVPPAWMQYNSLMGQQQAAAMTQAAAMRFELQNAQLQLQLQQQQYALWQQLRLAQWQQQVALQQQMQHTNPCLPLLPAQAQAVGADAVQLKTTADLHGALSAGQGGTTEPLGRERRAHALPDAHAVAFSSSAQVTARARPAPAHAQGAATSVLARASLASQPRQPARSRHPQRVERSSHSCPCTFAALACAHVRRAARTPPPSSHAGRLHELGDGQLSG